MRDSPDYPVHRLEKINLPLVEITGHRGPFISDCNHSLKIIIAFFLPGMFYITMHVRCLLRWMSYCVGGFERAGLVWQPVVISDRNVLIFK